MKMRRNMPLPDYLENINKPEPLPDIFFNPLVDKLKKYFISGGMPEVAVSLCISGIL